MNRTQPDLDTLPEREVLIDSTPSTIGKGMVAVGGAGLLIETVHFAVRTIGEIDFSVHGAITAASTALVLFGKRLINVYQDVPNEEAIESRKENTKGLHRSAIGASVLAVGLLVATLMQGDNDNNPTGVFAPITTTGTPPDDEPGERLSDIVDRLVSSDTSVTEPTGNTTNESNQQVATPSVDTEYSTDKTVVDADGNIISFVDLIGDTRLYACKLAIDTDGEGLYFEEGPRAISDISDIEQVLINLGYYEGPVTGNERGNTAFENALNRFEEANGFTGSRLITVEVCEAMPWAVDGNPNTP